MKNRDKDKRVLIFTNTLNRVFY